MFYALLSRIRLRHNLRTFCMQFLQMRVGSNVLRHFVWLWPSPRLTFWIWNFYADYESINPSPTGLLSAIRGFQIVFPSCLFASTFAHRAVWIDKSLRLCSQKLQEFQTPQASLSYTLQLNIICSIILILAPRSQSPKTELFCFGAYLAIVGILCKRQTTLVSWHNLSHPAVPSVKVFLRPHVKVYNGEFAKRKKFTSVRNLLSKVCKFLQRMLSRTDMG